MKVIADELNRLIVQKTNAEKSYSLLVRILQLCLVLAFLGIPLIIALIVIPIMFAVNGKVKRANKEIIKFMVLNKNSIHMNEIYEYIIPESAYNALNELFNDELKGYCYNYDFSRILKCDEVTEEYDHEFLEKMYIYLTNQQGNRLGNSKLGRSVYGKIYITTAKMFPVYYAKLISSVIVNGKVSTISELTNYIHFLISNTNMRLMPKPNEDKIRKSVQNLIKEGSLCGFKLVDDNFKKD
jgi:hypothetical protein